MTKIGQIIFVIIQIILFSQMNKTLSQTVFTLEIPEGRTQYDLQSNSSSTMLEQNPANSTELHAVFMVSTVPGPGWDNRNTRYFYSTNSGNSWSYVGTVTQTRSGFPSIDITNDSRAVILTHCTDGGGISRSQLFVDLAPGIGSWSALNPGTNGNQALGPIWPVCYVNKINNNVIWAASQNGVDSCFVNVCTNINSPGTFVGYKPVLNGGTAGQYSVGAAANGEFGIAYITLSGGAEYRKSTNGGQSWGAPVIIWTWNASDSMGAFRGIDITYQGLTPQVVFGVANIDPIGGSFNPGKPSKIMFWSPAVNGGNPVKIDSVRGLIGSNPQNDVHVSVCRPVVGNSASGNFLYAAYSRGRADTGSTGNNYFDIYVSCSQNSGASWSAPFKVTNNTGPLMDCRYPSISNRNGLYNSAQAINILYQSDSVPGSSIGGAANSWAKMMYARVTNLTCIPLAVNTYTGIPLSYTLKQNYPNPFNPVTQIEFALPVKSFARITIYNTLGEVVVVLLNENLSAGNYKVDWDASAYASGVYFYELKAEGYAETRKMALVK